MTTTTAPARAFTCDFYGHDGMLRHAGIRVKWQPDHLRVGPCALALDTVAADGAGRIRIPAGVLVRQPRKSRR